MWDWCSTTYPVARKEYECGASVWLNESGYVEEDFDPSDWTVIERARTEGFKIIPGERYMCTRGIWEGEWSTFRARLDIDEICIAYELYDE